MSPGGKKKKKRGQIFKEGKRATPIESTGKKGTKALL